MSIDRSIGVVGTGRAGRSFSSALSSRGWRVRTLSHGEESTEALDDLAEAVDIVLLCVPDNQISAVARSFGPGALDDGVVLAHCSGASKLDALSPAERRGSIHPLVSLSGDDPERLHGAWYAVDGDDAVTAIVESLEGRSFVVRDGDRALYHAGAAVASNHLVALLAQVEAIADSVGVPLDAFVELARASLGNVARVGPTAALTGPVSRGDWDTVRSHLQALPSAGLDQEVEAYVALARRAAVLAGRSRDDVPGL